MSELYNEINRLCKERNMTVTKLCQDTGITRSSLSELKMGRTKSLSSATINTIADYFQIPPDNLLRFVPRKISAVDLFSMPSTQKLAAALDEVAAAEEKKPTAETVDELTKIFAGLMSDFTDEEVREIRDYVQYLRWKRYRAEV